ncbi:AraC family transcriptional regulator [Chitinophaga tropicalis]|uniref:Helix-turn-helix domain-containing protein n=1 Tax=Chitinophaga tropicalis TaxID=2683588 RepID=A0A7K1U8I2_9BACT|nr:helix-turn-helix domain-containing protein [Chitinophaga tropicalis]MVT10590.1 helix-turn-helix domain-containing protein [Chitinophaga tropicalis]
MNTNLPIFDIPSTIKYYLSLDKKVPQSFGMDKYDELLHPDNFAILSNEGSVKNGAPIRTDHYAIILCIQGSCHKTVGPYSFEVTPQSVHIVSPKHVTSFENASDDLLLYMVMFKKEFITDTFIKQSALDPLMDLNPACTPMYRLSDDHYRKTKQLYERMDQEYKDGGPFYLQVVRLQVVELLYEINRAFEKCNDTRNNHQLSRQYSLFVSFRNLVEEHFISKRTVQEYADMLHITAKHLSEIVKQETGRNALQIIHNRLYLEAKLLLTTSTLSVKEISDQLNFDTSSHFSRFFKKFADENPSDFKKLSVA